MLGVKSKALTRLFCSRIGANRTRSSIVCLLLVLTVLVGSFATVSAKSYTAVEQWTGAGVNSLDITKTLTDVAVSSDGNILAVNSYGTVWKYYAGCNIVSEIWGSQGSGASQMNSAFGISQDSSGNLYVVDAGNQRVQKISSTGSFSSWPNSYGLAGISSYSAKSIDVSSTGYRYISDPGKNCVLKLDQSGIVVARAGRSDGSFGSANGEFNNPCSVAVDSSGNVYVADTGNSQIQKFDGNLKYLGSFGASGSGNSQFSTPMGVTVDSAGKIYVADTNNQRIQVFSSAFGYLASIGSSGKGLGEFGQVGGIAVDSSGFVYATDMGGKRVQKFDSAGTFQVAFGGDSNADGDTDDIGELGGVYSIAVADGYVYVADYTKNLIQKYTTSGVYVTSWFADFPTDLATDSSGNICVAQGGSIRRFTAAGVLNGRWSAEFCTTQLVAPHDVTVHGNYVFVADHTRVLEYTTSGSFVTQWGASGTGNGEFMNIWSIAVDESGNVYTTDRYRVQKFDSSGNYLTQWGVSGSGNGNFNEPRGVLVYGSTVYVADMGNLRIQTFTEAGTYTGQWSCAYPNELTSDSHGNLIMVSGGDIANYTTSGALNSRWSTSAACGKFNSPRDVTIDSSDNVYVLDSGNNRVEVFNSSGAFVSAWGKQGSGNGEFYTPSGIAVDSSGYVYITDTLNYRVQKFDNNGNFIRSWGTGPGAGLTQFRNPWGIAVDSITSEVYVADGENGRVSKYSTSGDYVGTFVVSDLSSHQPTDVAVDLSGNVFVVDTSISAVEMFTRGGTLGDTWGLYGKNTGELCYPAGIALDSLGNIYLTEFSNNRAQEFTSRGANLASWGSVGSALGQFNSPYGIAVNTAGTIFVADMLNNRIQLFIDSILVPTLEAPWGILTFVSVLAAVAVYAKVKHGRITLHVKNL